jgi:hypothetical protein
MRFPAVAIVLAMALSACGGGNSGSSSPSPPVYFYQQPDASICDSSVMVPGGLLCAIKPSRLDMNTRDFYGSGSAGDLVLGFGYHALAFPPTGTDIKGVYIHLTGSYGRPYNQLSSAYGNAPFLEEALSAGYITIQLAYDNRFSINIDECGGDSATLNIDNCSGDARMEKIVGSDVSSVVDTPLSDSIEFRLTALAEYLRVEGFSFPFSIVTNNIVNWASLRVGGHSQGATHALYLAKYFSASRACMLAGGFDIADTFPQLPPENLADWILDDSVTLDLAKIRAVVSVDDATYDSMIRSYDYLGLVRDSHYREVSGAPYSDASGTSINGHSAVLQDPRFAALRIEACFAQ